MLLYFYCAGNLSLGWVSPRNKQVNAKLVKTDFHYIRNVND